MQDQGFKRVTLSVKAIEQHLPDVLENTLDELGWVAVDEAQANVSGRVLHKRSGKLYRSIRYIVRVRRKRPEGSLHLRAGNAQVKYAEIHERGGIIYGKPWLTFQVRSGDWRTVRSVRIPARPYLEPAIRVAEQQIPQVLFQHLAPVLDFEGAA